MRISEKWPHFSVSRCKLLKMFCIPDIADPSSMQEAFHNEASKYDLDRHESSSS